MLELYKKIWSVTGRAQIVLIILSVSVAALAAVPLLQLLPLPGLSRLSLPGQADYYSVLELVDHSGSASLSILPRESTIQPIRADLESGHKEV